MDSKYLKSLLVLSAICFSLVASGNLPRKQKQVGTGITFAIPGLNLLGGGLGNNNNFFGQQTFTRTVVSTVSTVTTASFRTCTTTTAVLSACVPGPVGRRKREANQDENEINSDIKNADIKVNPTPAISLIIGTTTISNPKAVSDYLEAHKPSSQSVIYPEGVVIPTSTDIYDGTTVLYPSDETPVQDVADISNNDIEGSGTSELPKALLSDSEEADETTTSNPLAVEEDRARVGLGKTTVTTVIRVTSVATTIASGTMATLTVVYAGCMPQSYPITTNACIM